MRMGQGVKTGLGHESITCVLQIKFSIFFMLLLYIHGKQLSWHRDDQVT